MRSKSVFRLVLEPLAVAVVLALLVRAAIGVYAIPSESMAPTLKVGDHIIVTPYLFGKQPSRGDVVVFRSPLKPDELVVKRVIATPGDLIDSRLGRVRIGGYTLAEPYLLRASASGEIGAQLVPSNCYFVMGDNRAASYDSRNWGPLPANYIVGRARLILWSSSTGEDVAHASTRPLVPIE
ncbi:MAG TPA: signal peptidase I [Thermoanaerobaculia bacterium]|jgi:signal peptidase I